MGKFKKSVWIVRLGQMGCEGENWVFSTEERAKEFAESEKHSWIQEAALDSIDDDIGCSFVYFTS